MCVCVTCTLRAYAIRFHPGSCSLFPHPPLRETIMPAPRYIALSLFKRSSYVSTPVSWLVRGMHMKSVLNRRGAPGCNSCSHCCDVRIHMRLAHVARANIEGGERDFHYVLELLRDGAVYIQNTFFFTAISLFARLNLSSTI